MAPLGLLTVFLTESMMRAAYERLQPDRNSGYWPMLRVVYDSLYSSENRGVEERRKYQQHREAQNNHWSFFQMALAPDCSLRTTPSIDNAAN